MLRVAVGKRFVGIKGERRQLGSFPDLVLKSLLVSLSNLLLKFLRTLALKHLLIHDSCRCLTRHGAASNNTHLVVKVLPCVVHRLLNLSLLVVEGLRMCLGDCSGFEVVAELVRVEVVILYAIYESVLTYHCYLHTERLQAESQ